MAKMRRPFVAAAAPATPAGIDPADVMSAGTVVFTPPVEATVQAQDRREQLETALGGDARKLMDALDGARDALRFFTEGAWSRHELAAALLAVLTVHTEMTITEAALDELNRCWGCDGNRRDS